MKAVKIVAVVVAIAVVAFLLVGVFVPTFEYENRVVVDAPLAHSWTVFADTSRMADWLIGFKSMEIVSGSPNEVGSVYKFVFEENGDEMLLTEKVTAYQENELFAFTLDAEPLISTIEVTFTGDSTQTEIIAHNHLNGKNILWKSMLYLWKSNMQKRGQQNYDKLKRIIEESKPASNPSEPPTTIESR